MFFTSMDCAVKYVGSSQRVTLRLSYRDKVVFTRPAPVTVTAGEGWGKSSYGSHLFRLSIYSDWEKNTSSKVEIVWEQARLFLFFTQKSPKTITKNLLLLIDNKFWTV